MPYCTNCGAEIEAKNKYCPNCGAELPQNREVQNQAKKPVNNNPYNDEVSYSYTANSVDSSNPKNTYYDEQPYITKKDNSNQIIAKLVSILLVIGLICFIGRKIHNWWDSLGSDQEEKYAYMSESQEKATRTAEQLISVGGYSYNGIVNELVKCDFTYSDAVYAASNCGADWEKEAVEAAKDRIFDYFASYNEIVTELQELGFTEAQAIYAAENCGANWYDQAKRGAEYYKGLDTDYDEVVECLEEYDDFPHEQATYGASQAFGD